MPDIGMGLAPMGTSPFGFGTPAIANSSSTKVLKKPDGTQGAVPLIVKGDFVLDETGQKVGADAVPMQVQIALFTERDRSAVRNFGLDLALSIFTADAQRKADTAVRLALKHLTDKRAISVQSVTLDRVSQGGAQIVVRWVDLATGDINAATLPLGS